jgi:hypothetical protein
MGKEKRAFDVNHVKLNGFGAMTSCRWAMACFLLIGSSQPARHKGFEYYRMAQKSTKVTKR